MDVYTATEMAYKNGYEQGLKDAVKHGEWIRYLDFWMKCSECDGSWHEQWILGKQLNYCPNCGVKMR